LEKIANNLGILVAVIVSVGSLGWTFFQKVFQKSLPLISKWLCKKYFPAKANGVIIQWRTPRATMDRRSTNPRFDCYVVVHNFSGYLIKVETIQFWISSIVNREMHNIEVQNSSSREIHFHSSLTDGEYRALSQTIQYKRNEHSGISESQVGIRVLATTALGTTVEAMSSRDISFVLVEEHN
jgi:hypothetical protein